jgi:hypothetical protein
MMHKLTSKISAAYWRKDGLEIYNLVDKKPVKYASGDIDQIKPFRDQFGKKVLIVGRNLLLHHRKKYPPAPEKKIVKAVALEIGEIFPLQKPAFQCRIFKSFNTYTVVDIWAWETDPYDRIRKVFPFNFVVPEDLIYNGAEPEIKIFHDRGITHMLAHANGKFLAGASYPDGNFDQENAQRFINSLEQFDLNMRRVTIFGKLPFPIEKILDSDPADSKKPMIIRAGEMSYPVCLNYVSELDLKAFKVSGVYPSFWEKKDLFLRLCIYILLGYAALLFMTLRNYDNAVDEISKRISAMNNAAKEVSQSSEDYSDVYNDVNKKLLTKSTPLKVMNMLAQALPAGTFINRMVLNENHIEISVSSKEPLTVFKMLGNAPGVNKVSIKGPPAKPKNTSLYQFNMTVELSS